MRSLDYLACAGGRQMVSASPANSSAGSGVAVSLSVGSTVTAVGYGVTETNMNNSVRRSVDVTIAQLDATELERVFNPT